MSSLSLDNSDRRHLTPSQRAVIAVKHTEMLEVGDVKAQTFGSSHDETEPQPKSRTEVAKVAGVSDKTVERAKKALEIAPEKAEKSWANVSRHVEIKQD